MYRCDTTAFAVGTRHDENLTGSAALRIRCCSPTSALAGRDEDAFVAVECKRVEPGNSALSAGYVAEGINRFASGKYAAGHCWGFMLGYVLALPVDTIVAAIDQRVQKAYGSDAALAPIAAHPLALGVFENVVAQSAEHRIRLRHIFVDMLVAAPSAAVP